MVGDSLPQALDTTRDNSERSVVRASLNLVGLSKGNDQLITQDTTPLNLSPAQIDAISKLPQTARLKTTLYDIAQQTLSDRQGVTGEQINNPAIFREVNRIMVLNGYPMAHLANKPYVDDRNLPDVWNSIHSRQEFRLYAPSGNPLTGEPLPPPVSQIPANADMTRVAADLAAQHGTLSARLAQEESQQGFIGNAYDWAKNNIGSSAEGREAYDPRALWSRLFNSDEGSAALNQTLRTQDSQIAALKLAADKGDTTAFSSLYKDLTGRQYDAATPAVPTLLAAHTAEVFDNSQRRGVDTITDFAASGAALAASRLGPGSSMVSALIEGGLAGGITKAGLMKADGTYSSLGRDAAVGTLWGVLTPGADLVSSQASRLVGRGFGLPVTGNMLTARIATDGAGIGTRFLSAAAKTGIGMGTFAGIETPGREAIEAVSQGKPIDPSKLATDGALAGLAGFTGGTLVGPVLDASGFLRFGERR
jgi:hypothetical protein